MKPSRFKLSPIFFIFQEKTAKIQSLNNSCLRFQSTFEFGGGQIPNQMQGMHQSFGGRPGFRPQQQQQFGGFQQRSQQGFQQRPQLGFQQRPQQGFQHGPQ